MIIKIKHSTVIKIINKLKRYQDTKEILYVLNYLV
jgi:hypothetical protein